MYRTMLTSPVFGLRREIDRLFEDTFANGGERTGWVPAVNIRETADGFEFDMELAGLKAEDVELTCDNGVLTIRGERREERKEGDEGRYHLVERRYGEFTRSFQLPQGVDDEAIQADFDHGLLKVVVPKAEIPQPRRIRIQGSKQQGNREAQSAIRGPGTSESNGAGSKEMGNAKDGANAKEPANAKPRQREMAGAGSR